MFNELSKEIHQNAVEHGWWDEPRTFGEIVALCHSELSEALEEYRAGRPMVWYECDVSDAKCEPGKYHYTVHCCRGCGHRGQKPEGIAVELADCIIRILDWARKERVDVDYCIKIIKNLAEGEPEIDEKFGEFISVCHAILSTAYAGIKEERPTVQTEMCLVIYYIMAWAEKNNVNMYAIIREKMDYNETRPYRHGGKVL